MKEKYAKIIAPIVIIVVGIIIAVCGAGALDLYFGIGALAAGIILAIVNIVTIAKDKTVAFSTLFFSTAFIVVGIAFLIHQLSFGPLVTLVAYLILGLGAALVLYGLLTILLAKKTAFGLVQAIFGLVIIALVIVFLNVPEFAKAFWIVTGILIALYGAFELALVLTNKKGK